MWGARKWPWVKTASVNFLFLYPCSHQEFMFFPIFCLIFILFAWHSCMYFIWFHPFYCLFLFNFFCFLVFSFFLFYFPHISSNLNQASLSSSTWFIKLSPTLSCGPFAAFFHPLDTCFFSFSSIFPGTAPIVSFPLTVLLLPKLAAYLLTYAFKREINVTFSAV